MWKISSFTTELIGIKSRREKSGGLKSNGDGMAGSISEISLGGSSTYCDTGLSSLNPRLIGLYELMESF